MPSDSTDWSQSELVRAVINFGVTLQRIEGKLDERPSWDDVNRLVLAQKEKDTRTTTAQEAKDKLQDEGLKRLEDRVVQFFALGLGSLLAAGSSLVVSIVTR